MHVPATATPSCRSRAVLRRGVAVVSAVALGAGCSGHDKDESGDPAAAWQVVAEGLPGGVMSVQGTSAQDVWMVGAGGTAFHYDGTAVAAVSTGTTSDLWWVEPTSTGAVFVGAQGGIHEHSAVSGETSTIAGPQDTTFFGVWGADDTQLWAVGGDPRGDADPVLWARSGGTWGPAAIAPAGLHAPDLLYKVHGTSAADVWIVGTGGILQHFDGATWTDQDCGGDGVLFTVHTGGTMPVAVGGSGQALVCMYDAASDTWVDTTPPFLPTINGVTARGDTYVGVGRQGTVIRWDGTAWVADETPPTPLVLHATWLDEDGGLWAVGGNLDSTPITDGVILYQGARTIPPL
jgi:hypothetical protein